MFQRLLLNSDPFLSLSRKEKKKKNIIFNEEMKSLFKIKSQLENEPDQEEMIID